MATKVAVAAVLATSVEGFAPTLRTPGIPSFSKGLVCAHQPRLRTAIAPKMGYFDDLETAAKDKASLDGKGNVIMPDADYTGFVDATDGFDGGDGQVGVVGDGSNAMETFDNREVISASDAVSGVPAADIGGREAGTAGKFGASGGNRVDKRWNAWGTDSNDETFKEKLKEEGVTDVDIFSGEDYKFAQRQQLENWANQQKQWTQERSMRDQMASLGGEKRQKNTDDYKDFLMTGKSNDAMNDKDMENVIFATGAKGFDNSEQLKKSDWKPCKAGFRIDGEYEIVGSGLCSIILEPNSMVAEQYIGRFTDDSAPEFLVAATAGDVGDRQIDGMLPRRGTNVDLTIRFNPQGPCPEPKLATLVIDAEDNWKWTYKISGRT